ncbi:zinc ribbon domain-containing protein [Treponema zioleckii]|uniref:zinc ribbon domain-containing protein n=1 Tax=Treponema zioleckii TaxID=331680 RepID=UPI00168B283B|nr:C4-type zinc ribbon domain-containing protein [Treponema zioleckii]
MDMNEVFENLKNLQDILVEKYNLEEKITESPKQLDSQEEFLATLKKEYIEKNSVYEDVKNKVAELKKELAEAEESRESGEKGMDNITTHREYEALDKQIAEASEKANSVRKELLSVEKKLSELNEDLKTREAMINSQEADLDSGKSALAEKIDEYKKQVESLSSKEAEITNTLGDDYQETIYKFQRIIRRNSEGIVAVRNGVCTGCHMILPAQFANEVHDGLKILFCPYCSRILYHEDVLESEAENYSMLDETGSLADFESEFGDEFEDSELENSEDENDMGDDSSVSSYDE